MSGSFDWSQVQAGSPPDRSGDASRTTVAPETGAAIQAISGVSAALDEVLALTGSVLDRLRAGPVEPPPSAVGRSSGRHVSVEMGPHGQVTKVELDERWIETAHVRAISTEVLEACAEAQRELIVMQQQAMSDNPALQRLQQIAASPDSLLDFVGLGSDATTRVRRGSGGGS